MRDNAFEHYADLDPDLPVTCGEDYRRAGSGHDYVPHWHDDIEILYCTQGQGTVQSGGERIAMEEGDIVIINSGNLHTISSAGYCRYHFLVPDSSIFSMLRAEQGGRAFEGRVRSPRAAALMDAVMAEIQNTGDRYYKYAACGLLFQLFTLLLRRHARPAAGGWQDGEDSRTAMVKRAMRYIQANFRESITVDTLCAHVGLSKSYFCHSFKRVTGYSAVQYINLLRCQSARYLLMTGACNVSQSAARCGYNNFSYFTRQYKRFYGSLPSEEAKGCGP